MTGLAELAIFIGLAGLAAYLQTLTGFAFGLVLMGGVGLTGVMRLPDAAVFVSLLTLTNAVQVLARTWRHVAVRELGLILAASLPMQIIGFQLLGILAGEHLGLLRIVLGAVVIVSSLQLLHRPQPLARKSGPASYIGVGAISGLMGGLFSTSGPPLVYHLYRQPLPVQSIRETLVSVFAIAAVLRLGQVVLAHQVPVHHALGLLAIPAVIVATWAARRHPPQLSDTALRRVVFVLLLLSGVSLAVPPLLRLLAT